ncbi:MAG: thiamine pyrophosphate-binding protein [Chloroflexi bacterium]|nr:thiamine pyrophosphate-binding protein [Chloroflexota bacterium]
MGQMDPRCAAIIQGIEAIAPDVLIHIPDSTVAPVLDHFARHPTIRAFSVSREEEAVGMAAGLELAGVRCVLLVQDTGLGNSLTALTTFNLAYRVPTLLIVVRRGGVGEINSAVNEYSEHVPQVLQAAGIKGFTLDWRVPAERWAPAIQGAFQYAHTSHGPVAVLVDLKG